MNCIIIEDEPQTAKGLARMIKELVPQVNIVAMLDSVEDSVQFLSQRQDIDLLFLDIQLSDGLCFEIFEEIKIDIPVIFTTSFNEYAIKAFEINSIDYLLKPIQEEKLKRALEKYQRINKQEVTIKKDFASIIKNFLPPINEYRQRFLIKTGTTYFSLNTSDIAYFYIDDQLLFALTHDKKRYCINSTLEELEKSLNPKDFFRLNRQFFANINAIGTLHPYFNGSIKLELKPPVNKDVIVSRNNVKELKEWLDK